MQIEHNGRRVALTPEQERELGISSYRGSLVGTNTQPKVFTPELNSTVYYITREGVVKGYRWNPEQYGWQTKALSAGNIFASELLANSEAMRRESIKKRLNFVPTIGSTVWVWSFVDGLARETTFSNLLLADWSIGAVHSTEAYANFWGRKYSQYFKLLFAL